MSETNKSVLVIDTPENCRKCPLRSVDSFSMYCKAVIDDWEWCSPARKICDRNEQCVKPSWCPLTPLPPHKDLAEHVNAVDGSLDKILTCQYAQGYNDCLDDLLKGEQS